MSVIFFLMTLHSNIQGMTIKIDQVNKIIIISMMPCYVDQNSFTVQCVLLGSLQC
jgi:hypothetical protein